MKEKLPLKILDIFVLVFAAALIFISASSSRGKVSSSVTVKGPDRTWVFPLEAEELLSVTGSIGETLVEIHGGKAAIVSSPCGAKTCVAAGKIHKNGQWAACLPNRVFILIEGTDYSEDIDAVSW